MTLASGFYSLITGLAARQYPQWRKVRPAALYRWCRRQTQTREHLFKECTPPAADAENSSLNAETLDQHTKVLARLRFTDVTMSGEETSPTTTAPVVAGNFEYVEVSLI